MELLLELGTKRDAIDAYGDTPFQACKYDRRGGRVASSSPMASVQCNGMRAR